MYLGPAAMTPLCKHRNCHSESLGRETWMIATPSSYPDLRDIRRPRKGELWSFQPFSDVQKIVWLFFFGGGKGAGRPRSPGLPDPAEPSDGWFLQRPAGGSAPCLFQPPGHSGRASGKENQGTPPAVPQKHARSRAQHVVGAQRVWKQEELDHVGGFVFSRSNEKGRRDDPGPDQWPAPSIPEASPVHPWHLLCAMRPGGDCAAS